MISAEKGKRGRCSVSTEEGKKFPAKGTRAKASGIGTVFAKNVKAFNYEATGSQFFGNRRTNSWRII